MIIVLDDEDAMKSAVAYIKSLRRYDKDHSVVAVKTSRMGKGR